MFQMRSSIWLAAKLLVKGCCRSLNSFRTPCWIDGCCTSSSKRWLILCFRTRTWPNSLRSFMRHRVSLAWGLPFLCLPRYHYGTHNSMHILSLFLSPPLPPPLSLSLSCFSCYNPSQVVEDGHLSLDYRIGMKYNIKCKSTFIQVGWKCHAANRFLLRLQSIEIGIIIYHYCTTNETEYNFRLKSANMIFDLKKRVLFLFICAACVGYLQRSKKSFFWRFLTAWESCIWASKCGNKYVSHTLVNLAPSRISSWEDLWVLVVPTFLAIEFYILKEWRRILLFFFLFKALQ